VEVTRWILGLLLSALLSSPAAAQRSYTVREGDSLTRIAGRFRVSVDAIRDANRIRGERIRVGQRLRIPRGGRPSIRAARHRVREGDTLARIARRYRSTVEAIRIANGLRDDRLRPGQRLLIPRRGVSPHEVRLAARGERAARMEDATPGMDEAALEEAAQRAEDLGIGSLRAGHRLLGEEIDPAWIEAAGDPSALDGTLALPFEEARLLRGWGSGPGGYHLALDLGAPPGTPIGAVEQGIVAYVGRGMRGYGNMVIVLHPNGMVSAYAHNRRNLVVPGQLVARGQPLGEVGATGLARGPHLHFILVFRGEHCDALPLLRPAPATRRGDPIPEEERFELEWLSELPPSGVQCRSREEAPHPHRRYGRRRR
jgi:murein DD-endopeptidase MepM/ murein hydrolase activator NlpD